jgi:hypothetical protein
MNRRDLLKCFGALAVAGWMPHHAPRAKRVIFLCMRGGPSQLETFDPKPRLAADNLKPGRRPGCKLFASRWAFGRHGRSGLEVSELLPALARQADRLCVIRSMHTDTESHPQALEQLHTGSFQFIRPSMGAWVVYGLGTENRNLPGFLALSPLAAQGAARYYGSAFLPASYQATGLGAAGRPIAKAAVGNLRSPRLDEGEARAQMELLGDLDREAAARRPDDVASWIQAAELGRRMAGELPRVMDLSAEPKETLALYGIDGGPSEDFGRQCLLARRFAEAGVRFIELTHQDWDHHGFVSTGMPNACRQIDRPIAGLLADLERRGLLEETLVVWGGEFGRLPEDPTQDGRGHNNKGFSMWMAGGGVKGGIAHGATDEHGFEAVEDKVHVHDLHATILHLLGLDHERLTYRHGGRDFRLTDVHGEVVRKILA